jgi:hypothetical protein
MTGMIDIRNLSLLHLQVQRIQSERFFLFFCRGGDAELEDFAKRDREKSPSSSRRI